MLGASLVVQRQAITVRTKTTKIHPFPVAFVFQMKRFRVARSTIKIAFVFSSPVLRLCLTFP